MSGRTYTEIGQTGRIVAENIRRLRQANGYTTARLAEKAREHGAHMAPTTITKIEKCTRRLTVDELTAIAEALGEPPSRLLLPYNDNPVGTIAEYAAMLIPGPCHLEIEVDDAGHAEWKLSGRKGAA